MRPRARPKFADAAPNHILLYLVFPLFIFLVSRSVPQHLLSHLLLVFLPGFALPYLASPCGISPSTHSFSPFRIYLASPCYIPRRFQEAIQGQTLKTIQGPCTDQDALATLNKEISNGRATSSLLLNYKRDGSMFLNYLRVYPLVGDAQGTITHFLGVLQVRQVGFFYSSAFSVI